MDKKQISMVLHAASEAHDRQDLQAWLGQDAHPSISKIDLMAVAIESLFADRLSALSPRVVSDEVDGGWLIHKAGRGWYRPNAQGYTNDTAQAGRYSHEDALSYSHPNGWDGPRDGITIKHESELQSLRTAALSSAGEKTYNPSHQDLVDAYEARGCRDSDPSPHHTSADKMEVTGIIDRVIERCRNLHDYAGRTAWDDVLRDELRSFISDATRIITEQAEEIAELERQAAHSIAGNWLGVWKERAEAAEQAADAFSEICDELGCDRDNEAGLIAASALKADRDRMKVALEFYADVSKYPAPLTGGMGALWEDCGSIARETLSTLNGGAEK